MPASEPFFRFHGGLAALTYRQRMMGALKLGAKPQGKLLELGCGLGDEAAMLAEAGLNVEASDLVVHKTWPALQKASNGRLKFKKADASGKIPVGRYDVVLAKDMLHHADDPVLVIKRMAAAVKPGGRVIITEANRWNPVFYVHLTLMEGHEHFSRGKFLDLLAAAGLAGGELRRVEARVWPFNRPWIQAAFTGLQNFLQAFPLWWPVVCYHVYDWQKPLAAKKGPKR